MPNQEDIDSLLELLSLQRQTLTHYLKQQAMQGEAYVQPAIKHGIKESRQEIRRIKVSLRQLGVEIEDLPNDESTTAHTSAVPRQSLWIECIPAFLVATVGLLGLTIDSVGLFKISHSISGITALSVLIIAWVISLYGILRNMTRERWMYVFVVVIPMLIADIIAFFEIWQRGIDGYAILLICVGTGGLVITTITRFPLYRHLPRYTLRGRGSSRNNQETSRKSKIIYLRTALIMIAILSLSVTGIIYALNLNTQVKNSFVIIVADFDNGVKEPDKFGISETIFSRLQDNLSGFSDVSIEHMGKKINASDGKLIARKEGLKRNATIVIWGWYRVPDNKAEMFVNFELLKPVGPVDKINRDICKEKDVIDTSELNSFTMQISVSDEMTYLALSTLGTARFLGDDWQDAVNLFERAREIGGDYNVPVFKLFQALSYINLGQQLHSEIGNDNHIELLSKAIENNAFVSLTYYIRASLYEDKKEHDLAIKDYNKAIEMNSSIPCYYNDRGSVYREIDDSQNAILNFTQAISISNDFDYAYFNRGSVYFNEGQYDLAIADLNRAITLGDKDSYAVLGAAYVEKEEYDVAIKYLEESIRIENGVNSFAYLYLGTAQEKKGDLDNAIKSYNEVIRINDNKEYRASAEEALARLKNK